MAWLALYLGHPITAPVYKSQPSGLHFITASAPRAPFACLHLHLTFFEIKSTIFCTIPLPMPVFQPTLRELTLVNNAGAGN